MALLHARSSLHCLAVACWRRLHPDPHAASSCLGLSSGLVHARNGSCHLRLRCLHRRCCDDRAGLHTAGQCGQATPGLSLRLCADSPVGSPAALLLLLACQGLR